MRMGRKTMVDKKDKNWGKYVKWIEDTINRAGEINLKSKQRVKRKCKLTHLSNYGKAQILQVPVN